MKTGFKRQVRRHDGNKIQYTPADIKKSVAAQSFLGQSANSSGHLPKTWMGLPHKKQTPAWPAHLPKHLQYPSNQSVSKERSRELKKLLPRGNPFLFHEKAYLFGDAATHSPPSRRNTKSDIIPNYPGLIATMLKENVKGVETMRGQRGERTVTQMLQTAYARGLFMHGGMNSPVNSLVVPALRHVINWCLKQKNSDPKKKHIVNTLADACLDCQQVQAREFLRLFRELTNQAQTLELQVSGFLNSFKEAAIDRIITAKHAPLCDADHTRARPGQQRPHLRSAYITIAGDLMGMHDTLPSKNDRFLYDAKSEVEKILKLSNGQHIANEIMKSISVDAFFNGLLADINNQSKSADRAIDRKCIFDWAKGNMKDPNLVFYDSDRAKEYENQSPSEPTKENEYQPFLSRTTLLDILLTMKYLVYDPKYKETEYADVKEKLDSAEIKISEEAEEIRKLSYWLRENQRLKEDSIKKLEEASMTPARFQSCNKHEFMKLGLKAGQAVAASRLADSLAEEKVSI